MLPVKDKYACDEDGRDDESRKVFARLLGVRDGTPRKATQVEICEVSKHLFFYFTKQYEEGIASGFWDSYDEETAFPHEEYAFESHTTRDVDGIFGGFDFNVWAVDNLVNGIDGTKAVEVTSGPIQKKTMMYYPLLCGIGLENKIKQSVCDHLDAQGAVTTAVRNKKKVDIIHNIELFLKRKGWIWANDQHLFVDPDPSKGQQKMKKHCGKKVGMDWYILMLLPPMMQDEESA